MQKLKCCPFCGGALTESLVSVFLRERCIEDHKHFEPATDLYQAYVTWCRVKRYTPTTVTAFGRALGLAGLVSHRGHVVRWFGIRLKVEEKGAAKRRRGKPSRAKKGNRIKG